MTDILNHFLSFAISKKCLRNILVSVPCTQLLELFLSRVYVKKRIPWIDGHGTRITLLDITKWLYKVVEPISFPPTYMSLFFYILIKTWVLSDFELLPTWWVWNGISLLFYFVFLWLLMIWASLLSLLTLKYPVLWSPYSYSLPNSLVRCFVFHLFTYRSFYLLYALQVSSVDMWLVYVFVSLLNRRFKI